MISRNLLTAFEDKSPKILKYGLAALPFLICIVLFFSAAEIKHRENPNYKLLPTAEKMFKAIKRVAFTPDKRSGNYLLLNDTLASLKRILIGVGCAALFATFLGLIMGVFRPIEHTFGAFVTTLSMVPPLAVLPVLFIVFGLEEFGKIALIFIGTFPLLTRDVWVSAKALPREQSVKALTLGAGPGALAFKIVLPQILPRMLQSLRLSLGAAWLFLIAAEAIAATEGLGYRIFLLRRYMSMDIIIPYVLWITLLGYLMDLCIRLLLRWRFAWYLKN